MEPQYPMGVSLAPSVLAANFLSLGSEVEAASRAPGVDRIHFDVMDGRFVPNISFGPAVLEAIRSQTSLPLDVHLMIEEPSRFYADFAKAGASGLTVHVEACPHLHRDIELIHSLGMRAGVTLNPGTPIESLVAIVDYVDLILLMTVNPGFGGQRFIEGSIARIEKAKRLIEAAGREIELEVDGGIGVGTARRVVEAGARVLVAGSSLFRHPLGIEVAAGELLGSLNGARAES